MHCVIDEATHLVIDRIIRSKPRVVTKYEFDLFNQAIRNITIDGQTYASDPACIVFRKPGQVVYSQGNYDNLILCVHSENDAHTEKLFDSIPTCFHPTHVEELKEIVRKIIRIYEYDKQSPLLQNEWNRFIFLLLSDSFEKAASQVKEKSSRMHIVTSYIAKHYSEKIDIENLAEMIHLDKFYFIKYFKKKTGITPQQYLINTRIQEAKALLSRVDLPVADIAEMVGYTSASHFVSSFKKNTGQSPNQYRAGFLTK